VAVPLRQALISGKGSEERDMEGNSEF